MKLSTVVIDAAADATMTETNYLKTKARFCELERSSNRPCDPNGMGRSHNFRSQQKSAWVID